MARWENEDISGLNLPDPEITNFTFYGANACILRDKEKALAIKSHTGNSTRYYIRFSRGELFDPYTVDSNRKLDIKFKKVSQKSFEEYIKYLESKNRLYFTKSRRLAMEN